ncbi:Nin one binding Zn-ribbon like-domain-containing protein [Tuber brumale]|nr:Nin one binding Zn-ribbon like-domain-containing protein [Tuber brumale]
MLPEDQIPIDTLVIDAGPLIRNDFTTSILNRVGKLYSTPAVISEIRDAATRSRLETTWLPLLALRTPKPESVKVVSDFAKKTGDFSVLSVTDLQLLALTYELEVELNGGDWRLKSVPGQKKINGPVPKSVRESEEKKVEEDGAAKYREKAEDGGDAETAGANDISAASAEDDLSQKLDNTHILTAKTTPTAPTKASGSTERASPPPPGPIADEDSNPPSSTSTSSEDSDADADDWITPSNLHKHQSKSTTTSPPSSTNSTKNSWPIRAALATTDFALQSVTLQMNLHLFSTKTLQRIHTIRSHILRCHACFKLTRDMAKQFCPVCGGPTLQRVSCSADSKGTFKIYLKYSYQWNNRGSVFSLPKPTHGSANGKGGREVLILREDQKEYEREVARGERRKERDLLDPDYLPGILTGERRDAGGRPKIGYGRRNPNVARKGGKK